MTRREPYPVTDESARVLTREQCEALAHRVFDMANAPVAMLSISSQVSASTAFARGDTHLAVEQATVGVGLSLTDSQGRDGSSGTTRLDDAGIRALVDDARTAAMQHKPWRPLQSVVEGALGAQIYPDAPNRFSRNVLSAMAPEARAAVFAATTDAAEPSRLVAAGDLDFEITSRALINTKGLFAYDRSTYGALSVTARTADGTGSGWAWGGHEEWSMVKVDDVIARAVDLGRRSAHPVAVEPGRYTVIMEPPAVATLVEMMMDGSMFDMYFSDIGTTVYSKEPAGTNKIGLQMMDARLELISDPWDPDLPTSTVSSRGLPLSKVSWFERGILKHLPADASYAIPKGYEAAEETGGVRLFATGPLQTLEEMIAGTQRGVWINRLSNVKIVNAKTMLLTGTTRDGTFLIENGKITKAIKNFRFNESPFFIFNKLEAASAPVRASRGVVAPRLKVRDFDFTSLTDAI